MVTGLVDLRSDTVTQPTPQMRKAMAEAEVGDDVYGEDPTVKALEEAFAERVGKGAALYVPSGVMANQLALRVLARPGTTVVAGRRQHVVVYENAAAARNAGVQFDVVSDRGGTVGPEYVRWAIAASQHHQTTPGLVCVENTHMAAGGRPWPLDLLRELAEGAGTIPVHMDGARLFNAEVASSVTAAEYAGSATTVMCCLSKGLCAPVGSVLAGPADVIDAARLERSRMGGAMRQAGVIAAAGLVALRSMIDRLVEDHERAFRLAGAVSDRWPVGDAGEQAETNIVTFVHPAPPRLLEHLEGRGVLASTIAPDTVRLVTHRDVSDEGIERAIKALASAP